MMNLYMGQKIDTYIIKSKEKLKDM